jgi:uncharacterized membrane protein YbhN (UPF0104 family)
LQYGLGFGLLAWVVWSHWHLTTEQGEEVGLSAAWQRPVHVAPLLFASVLCLTGLALTFFRWWVLVRAQNLPFTLRSAFRLGMIGYYFNSYLPGSVGGDLIKAVCVAREQRRRTVAVATVLLDRVIGVAALFCLALLVGGWLWCLGRLGPLEKQVCATALTGVVALGGAWLCLRLLPATWSDWLGGWLLRVPRLGPSLHELWQAAWIYRGKTLVLFLTMAISVFSHAMQVLGYYFAGQALLSTAELPSLADHFVLVPAAVTVQAAVPAPGGVGGGEFAFGTLYAGSGSTFAAGVLCSLSYRVVAWIWGLVGYLLYWRLRVDMPPLPAPPPELAPE